jgi:hypothetical protein
MSTTFQPAPGKPVAFRVGCSCEGNQGPTFATYVEAELYYIAHDLRDSPLPAECLVGCEYLGQEGYCETGWASIKPVYAEIGPSLNVCNGNAITLLEALGIPTQVEDGPLGPIAVDAYGSLPADDFLGRVLVAEALSVGDPGSLTETHEAEGQATLVVCGRPEGYVDTKLAILREIALWAQARGVEVQWG